MSRIGVLCAAVALMMVGATAIDTSEQCICVPPTPCHYEGHCSALVGGFCSHGTELCDPVGGDTNPPTFLDGTPRARNIIDKSFFVDVKLSENGVFNWVLLENDSPAPNSLEVILGTGANSAEPLDAGEVAVLSNSITYWDFIGGLTANTPYDLYVTAHDSYGNVMASPTLVEVITDIDRYPPKFLQGFPTATSISHIAFNLDVKLDEVGTVFYVVLPPAADVPANNHVVAATVQGQLFASGSFAVTAEGTKFFDRVESDDFAPGTEVVVYAVTRDALGNVLQTPSALSVTLTSDTQPPVIKAGFPTVTPTDSTATLSVQLDEAGVFYAIVVAVGTLEPSPSSLRASALAGASGSVIAAGTGNVVAKFTTAQATLSGLRASTDYTSYVVGADSYGNLGVVSRVDFTTLADATPPTWLENPALWGQNLRDVSFECVTRINEPGTVFISARPRGGTPPTPQQIRDEVGVNQASVVQAGAIFVIPITGLTPETEYTLYAVAADATGNLQAAGLVQASDITTLRAVSQITAGPTVTDITESTAVVKATVSQPDTTVYVAVLPASQPAPTAASIRSATSGGGVSFGSAVVAAAGGEASIAVDNLIIASNYVAYVVTSNADNVLLLTPRAAPFLSGGDVEFPDWVSGYPRVTNIKDRTATLQVKLTEAATVSYVVLLDGTAGPTVEAVLERSAGGAVAVGQLTVSQANELAQAINVGTFKALTQYDAYFVAEDPSGNVQPVPTLVEFATTQDVTPPSVRPGWPRITSITQASAQVSSRIDEDGTMYVVAKLAGAGTPVAPTTSSVISGAGGVAHASVALEALETGAVAITGLTPITEYDLWIVYVDGLGNASPPSYMNLITSEDVGPPEFVQPYPVVVDIGENGASVEVKTTEPGRFFYIVVPDHHATPLAVAVRDAAGTNILAFGAGNLADPSTVGSSTFAGLKPDTPYDLYVVAQDSVSNLQLTARLVEFRTLPDTTAPTITAGYPLIADVKDRSIGVNVRSDEDATWHIVVLPASAPLPTSAQVKAGTGAGNAQPVSYATGTATAFTIVSVPARGLTPATDYIVYVVAADANGNVQAVPAALPLTTAVDTFAPIFVSPYPDVGGITENYITVDVKVNEKSVVHYVVLPNGAAAPTAADIIAISTANNAVDGDFYSEAGDGAAGGNAGRVNLASGWQVYTEANSVLSIDIATGPLESETQYDIYVVAIDVFHQANTPRRLDVTTVLDNDPPLNAAGFPAARSVIDASAVIEHKTNEHGRFFAVALARGATAPTRQDVVAGTGKNGAIAASAAFNFLLANTASTATLYNLVPLTQYDVWVVAEDWAGNWQAAPVKIEIATTADIYQPGFVAPSPTFAGATPSFVSVGLIVTEPSRAYWVVVPVGSAAPSVADVVSGTGALESGSDVLGTAGSSLFVRIPTDKLDDDTSYDTYWVLEDAAGNRSPSVATVVVITIVDNTAPAFRVGYPSISDVTARSGTVDIVLTERASVTYIVVKAGPAQLPNVAEVQAGTAAGGQAAIIAGSVFVTDADVVTSVPLNFLDETTSYDVFLVAQDSKSNVMAAPAVLRFTTLPDFDAAVISDPGLEDVTDSSWFFRFTLSEAATIFWIIAPQGADTPTANQIINGQTATGETPVDSGSFNVNNENVGFPYRHFTYVFTQPETTYAVFWVAVDRAADPNIGAVGGTEVTTTGDVSFPRPLTGYPFISKINANDVIVEAQYHEACNVYWVVVNAPFATNPVWDASSDEVKAGVISGLYDGESDGEGAAAGSASSSADGESSSSGSAGGAATPTPPPPTVVSTGTGRVVAGRVSAFITLNKLFPITRFVAYMVAEDDAGNLAPSSNVHVFEIETAASGTSAQAAQQIGLFGQGDTGAMDFTFIIIGVIVLLLLVLCCCVLGRRKKKYTHLEGDGKVTPDGDVVGWEGPDGDYSGDEGGAWGPIERASVDKWGNRRGSAGAGSADLSDITGELDDEFVEGPLKKHAGAPGMNLEPLGAAAGGGEFELNRTPVLGGGAGSRRDFVNREMMDLDLVLREAEDVSTSVMNRAPEIVEDESYSQSHSQTGSGMGRGDGSAEYVSGETGTVLSGYTAETSSDVIYTSEVRSSEVRSSEVVTSSSGRVVTTSHTSSGSRA